MCYHYGLKIEKSKKAEGPPGISKERLSIFEYLGNKNSSSSYLPPIGESANAVWEEGAMNVADPKALQL